VAVTLESGPSPAAGTATVTPERLLALWQPGTPAETPPRGAGFELPAGARVSVRVLYRKTWQNERDLVRDRTQVALYFTSAAAPIQAIRLAPSDREAGTGLDTTSVVFARRVETDVRAVAIHADAGLHGARVAVRAARPDGSNEDLIVFQPLRGWTRRYWYREPVTLPAGTSIEVHAKLDASATLLPPGVPAAPAIAPGDVKLTLDVVAAR
jgi:hypothetical protein